MQKMMRGTVSCRDNGLKLDTFLKTGLHLSKKEISRAKFLENGICVNGKRCKTDAMLKTGDLVEIVLETGDKISENLTASGKALSVLYEDEDVIILDKPAGISVHPAGRKDTDTLANRLAYYLRDKNEDSVIRIFGRLDKDTSGVVLAVKNRAAATRLAHQRESGTLHKTYLAITEGLPNPPAGVIRLPIGIDPGNRKRMCITLGGKNAVTNYETLAVGNGCALVRLSLETGRTHQIRVHMAAIGCPLVGDPLYGYGAEALLMPDIPLCFSKDNRCKDTDILEMKRTALHACSIHFLQPFTGEELLIEAPLPVDMKLYLSGDFP